MAMNISGFGTSNASNTGMNTGNKGYKAAEEAVLADVMAEDVRQCEKGVYSGEWYFQWRYYKKV